MRALFTWRPAAAMELEQPVTIGDSPNSVNLLGFPGRPSDCRRFGLGTGRCVSLLQHGRHWPCYDVQRVTIRARVLAGPAVALVMDRVKPMLLASSPKLLRVRFRRSHVAAARTYASTGTILYRNVATEFHVVRAGRD